MSVPLNIDWQQILLHLFNFVILAGGLYFLLYKPVKKFMDNRTAYYQTLDANAEEKVANAKKLEEMYQNRLNDAETEIRDKKTRAVKEAEEEANAVLADAKKKKEQMLLDAREAAQHEKIRIIREAKEDIAELASAATAKLLQQDAAKQARTTSGGEAADE